MSTNLTYPFKTDAAWANWGRTSAPAIAADAVALGLPADVAGTLGLAAATYVNAYDAAVAPETRSTPKVQAKADALVAFKAAAQTAVRFIQANPDVTNERRKELGLRVYDTSKTPAPVPGVPSVTARMTGPDSARVIVRDPADPDRRAKPEGVGQVLVYTMFGEQPAFAPDAWTLYTASGRTRVELSWPGLAEATTVWISCQWQNTRKEAGPMSTPVRVRLAGFGSPATIVAQPEDEATGLKIAA